MNEEPEEEMDETEVCLCDHELQDHDDDLACMAEDCVCSYFTPDPTA